MDFFVHKNTGIKRVSGWGYRDRFLMRVFRNVVAWYKNAWGVFMLCDVCDWFDVGGTSALGDPTDGTHPHYGNFRASEYLFELWKVKKLFWKKTAIFFLENVKKLFQNFNFRLHLEGPLQNAIPANGPAVTGNLNQFPGSSHDSHNTLSSGYLNSLACFFNFSIKPRPETLLIPVFLSTVFLTFQNYSIHRDRSPHVASRIDISLLQGPSTCSNKPSNTLNFLLENDIYLEKNLRCFFETFSKIF